MQGRDAEALAQWQAAVAEQPAFAPAWVGLGELALGRQDWAELERAAGSLAGPADAAREALLLRVRAFLVRREFTEARRLLEATLAADPQALPPRVLLTHALLQEGRDPAAAERALRDVLTRAPAEAESWRNLAVLLRQQGRPGEAAAACRSGLVHCPGEPGLLLLYGLLLHEFGDLTNAETCLVRALEVLPLEKESARDRVMAARQHLAQIYTAQGRLEEAAEQWRAVQEERPNLAVEHPPQTNRDGEKKSDGLGDRAPE
jgi:tetratricopeptide (TPR) repeat protein